MANPLREMNNVTKKCPLWKKPCHLVYKDCIFFNRINHHCRLGGMNLLDVVREAEKIKKEKSIKENSDHDFSIS